MPSRKYFGRTLFYDGEIPAYTFFKAGVETLILPSNVNKICEGVFAGSSVKEIVIPEGVTEIGDYAFYGCQDVEKITLPASLKTIGKGTFGNCAALQSIDLSATKINEIPERAFAGSLSLSSVTLPQQVTKIGREAFSHTGIKTLVLNNVADFEAYALSGMPYLEQLTINPSAKIADGLLMDDISLVSLTGMPEMVPDYFAANCTDLSTQSTAGRAARLGKYSFANTAAPSKLILSNKLASIDRGALSGLNTITEIDASALEGKIPYVDEFSFEGLSQPDITLLVTEDFLADWKADPVWSLFNLKAKDANDNDGDGDGDGDGDNKGDDDNKGDGDDDGDDDNKGGNSGIEGVDSQKAGLDITYAGNVITVESPSLLNDVRIFTADGHLVFASSAEEETLDIDTSTLPSGIVIIVASDKSGHNKTLSILLK